MREKAVKIPRLEPEIRIRPPKRQSPTPSRHSLKCAICNHPDRAAIEFDFLNWRNPADLVKGYRFRGLSTIYRHAHATGLFAKRRLNLRFAMERIVERVNEVPVTATAVIRAARAIARINDAGQWIDPPSHLFIHRADSEETLESESPAANGSCSGRSNAVRAGTEAFVGRGFNRDKKIRSSKPSIRARQGAEGKVPSIPAHDGSETISRPSRIFDEVLLDEPSDSASAELPRIDGKPAPTEVILELTPEFARCREVRRRGIEEDRQARAESGSRSGGFTPPASPPPAGAGLALPVEDPERSRRVPAQQAQTPRGKGSHPVQENSERRAASGLATNPDASPPSSSLLPQAAPDKPAAACPEQGRGAKQPPPAAGPPLGSSGSVDPPFPFTPEPLRRRKPRRRF